MFTALPVILMPCSNRARMCIDVFKVALGDIQLQRIFELSILIYILIIIMKEQNLVGLGVLWGMIFTVDETTTEAILKYYSETIEF